MWIWTEEGGTAVNLDRMVMMHIVKESVAVAVIAHDDANKPCVLKLCDTEEEARKFVAGLMISCNSVRQARMAVT